jgi:segregation and condensation protein B
MKKDLEHIVECLLFVHGEPMSVKKLARAAGAQAKEIKVAVESLDARLKGSSGLRVVQDGDEVQLVTARVYAPYVEKLFREARREELSRASLEVLAIVAYEGPVSREEIESIRGVNSAYILRTLSIRGLVAKKNESPPMYELSLQSLRELGLESREGLPHFEEVREKVKSARAALGVEPRT